MFRLCIFCRKENRASTEIHMFNLNPYEFADATTELINNLKHQLVVVIVNTVEKALELIDGQIPDDLTETFIPF